ncbi:autotransporter domain-containing protein [Providencia rustigianii]|uniref:autotransporter domain-containing protein n=1 Tax=Providencia rustigianii TaxID=158850 RepID=UPI0022434081|nr:autotransporter domain-containing protein [Providencia rustigianii]
MSTLRKSHIALALSLALSGYANATQAPIIDIVDLGGLQTGSIYTSITYGISTDGKTIVGQANNENGNQHAFIWRDGKGMVSLGTLATYNDGFSSAHSVSADGKVVVGHATSDFSHQQAFIWREGKGMLGLGTLMANNSGTSSAIGVSADGTTVVGNSSINDNRQVNAFIWRENTGMTGLGTLVTGDQGYSSAKAVSADGTVVVGVSDTDNGKQNAFIWREDKGMTSLGTLEDNNQGFSSAHAVSADGKVIVGQANTNHGEQNAFIWRDGEGMTGLGTLASNNSGDSYAKGVSADGKVVVGSASTDSGKHNAFIWREEDNAMTGLGTLTSNNSGSSYAHGVSADGTVVVGSSMTDSGREHATVWKIKDPSSVTIVDATNSSKAMSDTGRRGFKVLDLYQSSLNSLSQSRCQLGESDYCVGIFTQYDSVSSNHRTAAGLFGALRLPAENWIVGGAMNFATSTDLIDNYDTRGSNQPGVGMFIRYQQNRDNTGFNAELSGAFLQQGLTITRDQLTNTEAGQGDSRVKGYQANLSARYGFDVTPNTLVSPEVTLTHHKVTRDGYTETRHAEFAGSYEKMGNTRTDLQVGINAVHQLNNTIQLDGNIGANVKLHSERDAFVGYIPYIGAYAYDAGDERTVRPFVSAGINVNVTKNSTVRANVGWQQTDYQHDAANVGLSYSYHW